MAFHIIGGGEEGDKTIIRTKEEADHSLQYMVAVALLDGNVLPAQYEADRIVKADVQDLLKRVVVRPRQEYTDRFPQEVVTTLRFTLKNGTTHEITKTDYEGFNTRPMSWDTVVAKFTGLATPFTSEKVRRNLIDAVRHLEDIQVRDLVAIIADLKA